MNKLILYGILLLVYLGLSKSLSPGEYGIRYINKKEDLIDLIPGQPVSAILADMHSTGFLIKTYYQKYKIVLNDFLAANNNQLKIYHREHYRRSVYNSNIFL